MGKKVNYKMVEELRGYKKYCRKCKQWKTLSEFNSDAHQFDGKSCYCKDCINSRQKLYNAYKRQGRIFALTKYGDEDLLNEIKYRMHNKLTTE